MFTGIVETVGTVARIERRGSMQRATVRAPEILDDVVLGDSISLSGACQTVIAFDGETFQFDSVAETLRLTNIGTWTTGTRVNLERSLKVGARLGGHWVTGHVDGLARLVEVRQTEESAEIRLEVPAEIVGQIAQKGSVALDGISLTVTDVKGSEFGVAVIPFTLEHTTLADRRPGDRIHIETDVLAKYVDRLIHSDRESESQSDNVTLDLLAQAGFTR
jgi:riboflavin synthase